MSLAVFLMGWLTTVLLSPSSLAVFHMGGLPKIWLKPSVAERRRVDAKGSVWGGEQMLQLQLETDVDVSLSSLSQ